MCVPVASMHSRHACFERAGRRVKPTLALNNLTEGLNAFGFDVGWDNGNLQVGG